jgi:hypothetical protein
VFLGQMEIILLALSAWAAAAGVPCLTPTLFKITSGGQFIIIDVLRGVVASETPTNLSLQVLTQHNNGQPPNSTRKEAAERRQKQAFSRDPMSISIHRVYDARRGDCTNAQQ